VSQPCHLGDASSRTGYPTHLPRFLAMKNLRRALKWTGVAVASLLLALGVQSSWSRIGTWVSPPPPPLARQIDDLVHVAARHGLALQYQSTARLHPGGDLSYVFVFKPAPSPRSVVWPSSELRIYDVRGGRLKSAYLLRPLTTDAYTKRPWTFGIDALDVASLSADGTDEIVASLGLYAADAIPTFPVIVRWRAATDSYRAEPVMSGPARPVLHGSHVWTHGYLVRMTVWNDADPRERFVSYHAEAVQVEPGRNPVLLGIFYAHAHGRVSPQDLEINVWLLSGESPGVCAVGTRLPAAPLFVKVTGFSTYDQLMSRTWARVHSITHCG
jgi:hypothetical protein